MTWHNYKDRRAGSSVVGTLLVRERVWSSQLRNRRSILVALPPGYEEQTRRYPVVYMHDGQNLFDHATSYAGEWQVDETLQMLSHEGIAAIVVGIPNSGTQRVHEYSPFPDRRAGGGRGEAYLQFLAETVKPIIDREFRTLPEREHTGILGSSMGGLISLYAFFRDDLPFGFAGVMSPSLWFARGAVLRYVARAGFRPGRLYVDIGGREGPPGAKILLEATEPSHPVRQARELQRILIEKGYRSPDNLLYVEASEATHSEAEWARRLPDALRFLLGPFRTLS